MAKILAGKIALVTGGSCGIGAATILRAGDDRTGFDGCRETTV